MWTLPWSEHTSPAQDGAWVNSQGASPWYAGASTLECNAALNRAEVPCPGRKARIVHGIV